MSTEVKEHGRLIFKQSSELEILISAAIVFAAFSIMDVVPEILSMLINNNVGNSSAPLIITALLLLFLSKLLPISIITHFILRFYWLSLVGLKTAFNTNKLEKLNYAEKYKKRISKNGDLENHINVVDKICSSIFAFSFLAVFVFCFSIVSFTFIVGFLAYLIETVFSDSWLRHIFAVLQNIFVFLALITFIDFFSLGLLKKIKKRWFVKVYYPISRFMGFITLSYFYRGLYYTFITNIPKKIAVLALPLYLILAILLLNAGFYESKLYAEDREFAALEENVIPSSSYKENFNKKSIVQIPFIDEYIVDEDYIQIYIPVTEDLEDNLLEHCDSLVAPNERGFHWRKWITTGINRRELPENFSFKENGEIAITCMSNSLTTSVDDKIMDSLRFRFATIQNPDKIILKATTDISHLSKGDHILTLQFKEPLNKRKYTIPFYKTR